MQSLTSKRVLLKSKIILRMTEKSVEQSGLTVGTVLGLTHKTNGGTKNEIFGIFTKEYRQ